VFDGSKKIMTSRPIGFVGQKYSLGCLSGGNTTWYHKSPVSYPIATGNILKFDRITSEQAGDYYCHGLQSDSSKLFIAKHKVILYSKYNCSIIIKTNIIVSFRVILSL